MEAKKWEDTILANEQMNDWCGTKGINYYEGIEALGFLFEYAVPKIITVLIVRNGIDEYEALRIIFARWLEKFRERYSFEDALFWAIYPIIVKEED